MDAERIKNFVLFYFSFFIKETENIDFSQRETGKEEGEKNNESKEEMN